MGDLPVLVLPDLLDLGQMVDDLDLLGLDPMVRMVDVVPKLAAVDQKVGEVPKMDPDQMADR